MNRNLPILQADIDEMDDLFGINLISIVPNPAMESNFVALSAETEEYMLAAESIDQEKQVVTGAVLIPDKLIPRINRVTGDPYYLNFSAESIEKMRNKFFRTGNLKQSNLDHSKDDVIEGYLIESWIVENEKLDKAVALGLPNVKKGAMYASYHFPDPKVWELVKERKGFSIEGMLKKVSAKPVELSEQQIDNSEVSLDEALQLLDE